MTGKGNNGNVDHNSNVNCSSNVNGDCNGSCVWNATAAGTRLRMNVGCEERSLVASLCRDDNELQLQLRNEEGSFAALGMTGTTYSNGGRNSGCRRHLLAAA
jgi:hypothetical protein